MDIRSVVVGWTIHCCCVLAAFFFFPPAAAFAFAAAGSGASSSLMLGSKDSCYSRDVVDKGATKTETKTGPGNLKTVLTVGRGMLGTETKVEIEDSKTGIEIEDWKFREGPERLLKSRGDISS